MNDKVNQVKAEDLNPDAKHRFVFQFISAEDGIRSEPFESNWTEMKEILELRTDEQPKPTDDDFILLVAVIDGKQTHIPTSPILKVSSYLQVVGDNMKEAS